MNALLNLKACYQWPPKTEKSLQLCCKPVCLLVSIELDVNENVDIHDFKRVCKRLACALGYDSNSVEEAFEGKSKPIDKIKQILKG